jgi:hypothetical protein
MFSMGNLIRSNPHNMMQRERRPLGKVEIKVKAISQRKAFIRGGRDQGEGN